MNDDQRKDVLDLLRQTEDVASTIQKFGGNREKFARWVRLRCITLRSLISDSEGDSA